MSRTLDILLSIFEIVADLDRSDTRDPLKPNLVVFNAKFLRTLKRWFNAASRTKWNNFFNFLSYCKVYSKLNVTLVHSVNLKIELYYNLKQLFKTGFNVHLYVKKGIIYSP